MILDSLWLSCGCNCGVLVSKKFFLDLGFSSLGKRVPKNKVVNNFSPRKNCMY